jgi:hypothetical protein
LVVLASLDRRSEDIRILPVIISELELGNIQRHIFPAHFVERADHATLEDRPETFDCLCVNCANDISTSCVFGALTAATETAIDDHQTAALIGAASYRHDSRQAALRAQYEAAATGIRAEFWPKWRRFKAARKTNETRRALHHRHSAQAASRRDRT